MFVTKSSCLRFQVRENAAKHVIIVARVETNLRLKLISRILPPTGIEPGAPPVRGTVLSPRNHV